MAYKLTQLIRKMDKPRLSESQETRNDARLRLGLSDAAYEAAKSHLSFPVGQQTYYGGDAANFDVHTAWVVDRRDIDTWRDAVLAVAAELAPTRKGWFNK